MPYSTAIIYWRSLRTKQLLLFKTTILHELRKRSVAKGILFKHTTVNRERRCRNINPLQNFKFAYDSLAYDSLNDVTPSQLSSHTFIVVTQFPRFRPVILSSNREGQRCLTQYYSYIAARLGPRKKRGLESISFIKFPPPRRISLNKKQRR